MKTRLPYDPAADLVTERVQIGLPLRAKEALAEAAAQQGESLSGYVREAVRKRMQRDLKRSPRQR